MWLWPNSAIRFQSQTGYTWYNGISSTSLNLDNSGNLVASGNVSAYSDSRLKTNIVRITNALTKIGQLNGYTYDRTDTAIPERNTGVIAQEVVKVLPEAVQADAKGFMSVSYGNMVGLLIEGINSLAASNASIIARLTALEKKSGNQQ